MNYRTYPQRSRFSDILSRTSQFDMESTIQSCVKQHLRRQRNNAHQARLKDLESRVSNPNIQQVHYDYTSQSNGKKWIFLAILSLIIFGLYYNTQKTLEVMSSKQQLKEENCYQQIRQLDCNNMVNLKRCSELQQCIKKQRGYTIASALLQTLVSIIGDVKFVTLFVLSLSIIMMIK